MFPDKVATLSIKLPYLWSARGNSRKLFESCKFMMWVYLLIHSPEEVGVRTWGLMVYLSGGVISMCNWEHKKWLPICYLIWPAAQPLLCFSLIFLSMIASFVWPWSRSFTWAMGVPFCSPSPGQSPHGLHSCKSSRPAACLSISLPPLLGHKEIPLWCHGPMACSAVGCLLAICV